MEYFETEDISIEPLAEEALDDIVGGAHVCF